MGEHDISRNERSEASAKEEVGVDPRSHRPGAHFGKHHDRRCNWYERGSWHMLVIVDVDPTVLVERMASRVWVSDILCHNFFWPSQVKRGDENDSSGNISIVLAKMA